MGQDRIVPFAVESVGAELDGGKLRLTHLDPFRVLACSCEEPSFVLRFACKLYFCSCNSSATSTWLTLCPWARNSSARFRTLLHVHRSGDCGSPRVTGSSSFSRSSSRSGSLNDAFFRPPPFCRIGRCFRCERSGFFRNSANPTAMARLETPLARDTSEMPPRPWAALSAAAHKRRACSSSHASNWEKRFLISASLATKTF